MLTRCIVEESLHYVASISPTKEFSYEVQPHHLLPLWESLGLTSALTEDQRNFLQDPPSVFNILRYPYDHQGKHVGAKCPFLNKERDIRELWLKPNVVEMRHDPQFQFTKEIQEPLSTVERLCEQDIATSIELIQIIGSTLTQPRH
jgi:hypothetical protein